MPKWWSKAVMCLSKVSNNKAGVLGNKKIKVVCRTLGLFLFLPQLSFDQSVLTYTLPRSPLTEKSHIKIKYTNSNLNNIKSDVKEWKTEHFSTLTSACKHSMTSLCLISCVMHKYRENIENYFFGLHVSPMCFVYITQSRGLYFSVSFRRLHSTNVSAASLWTRDKTSAFTLRIVTQ